MRIVDTPRLSLRPPQASDLEPFVEIHEDPEVMRHISVVGKTTGRVAAWRLLALLVGHWELRGYGQWTVVERDTHEVVGRVGLWNPEGWPGLEIGWVIRRSRWGRGYATEAAEAAVAFAFGPVGAGEVISLIRPDNARSIRVAAKIGERRLRTEVIDGVTTDVYGMTSADRRPT